MALELKQDSVVIGKSSVRLAAFTQLVGVHLRDVAGTREIESQGSKLIESGFADARIGPFIQRVCTWGGYAGIGARVLTNNRLDLIRDRFTEAMATLELDPPDVREALVLVNQINQLGRPSFASKHLRFLRPDLCPVLDSVVVDGLPYWDSPSGFAEYSHDCIELGQHLGQAKVRNPMGREGGRWFAADVDMAVYTYLQGWA